MKIAIIGSGFSGIMTFYYLVKLLAKSENKIDELLEITIISKEKNIGGIAYAKAASSCDFLMNIPIDKMSALEDEPNDLLEWLNRSSTINKDFYTKGKRDKILPNQYCRREDYGKYLQAKYEEAKKDIGNNKKPIKVQELFSYEVTHISKNKESTLLKFKNIADESCSQIDFDRVVIASGNDLPFKKPSMVTEKIANSSSYISSIWDDGAIKKIQTIALEENKKVLVLGTALSSMDLVIAWYEAIKRDSNKEKSYTSQLILSSRHGLLHETYPKNSSTTAVESRRNNKITKKNQPKEILEKNIKALVKESEEHTHQFRENKYNDLIELTNLACLSFNEDEKIKLLPWITRSHLETMATGMPYPTTKKIAALAVENLLDVCAGEIVAIDVIEDQDKTKFDITYKNGKKIIVDYIVNAIGVEHDYTKLQHPFYESLMKIAVPHDSGFDLKTSNTGLLITRDNGAQTQIYCVGPMRSASEAMKDKPVLSLLRSIVKLRKQPIVIATELLSGLDYTVVSSKTNQKMEISKQSVHKGGDINYLPLDEDRLISESFIKMTDSDESYLSTVLSDVLIGNGNNAHFINSLFINSSVIRLKKCKIVEESKLEIKAEKAIFTDCEIDLNGLESNSNRNFKVDHSKLIFTKNADGILWQHTGEGNVKLNNVTFFVNSPEGTKKIMSQELGIENGKKLHGFLLKIDKNKQGQEVVARWKEGETLEEKYGKYPLFSKKKQNLWIDTHIKELCKNDSGSNSPKTPTLKIK